MTIDSKMIQIILILIFVFRCFSCRFFLVVLFLSSLIGSPYLSFPPSEIPKCLFVDCNSLHHFIFTFPPFIFAQLLNNRFLHRMRMCSSDFSLFFISVQFSRQRPIPEKYLLKLSILQPKLVRLLGLFECIPRSYFICE